jgi:uncharacterized protein (TIGR02001 family)
MKRSNKALNITFLGAVLLSVVSAPVFAGIEGNITLASNYIWRGIDRNNTNPAIQGGFDLNFENGLYAGVWGSNVSDLEEEADPATPASNNIEMDFYGGYTQSMGDFVLDLGYIRYEYPKASDMKELMIQGAYKGLSMAYYHTLEGGEGALGEQETYIRAKADINLPGAVGMTLSVGQTSIEDQEELNDGLIGFYKHAAGVKLGIAGTTSNLNHITKQDIETDFVTVSISKAL